MRDPSKHPVNCLVCGRPLPVRDEPRGRARLYCPQTARPCKERQRALVELQRRAEAWDAAERTEVADRIRKREAALRLRWKGGTP